MSNVTLNVGAVKTEAAEPPEFAKELSDLGARPGETWSLYSRQRRILFLSVLLVIATLNMIDRVVVSILLDPIKAEFHLSDTELGVMSGLVFALFFSVSGIPIARWADRGNRRTILALALAIWSGMTVLSGVAQSWRQLLLARMGVGLAAAGSEGPTQSLIADYFPPERRTLPIALVSSTGNLGYFLGIAVGGYFLAKYGWRAAFVFVGAPGLLAAIIARMTLAEPRQILGFPGKTAPAESLGATVTALSGNRTFVRVTTALALYAFFGYGVSMFLPSFIVRALHASFAELTLTFGAALSVSMAAGALMGGVLSNYLGKRDSRWYAWLPSVAYLLAVPIYVAALHAGQFNTFIVLYCIAEAIVAASFPGAFICIHNVCGDRRRAMAFAVVFLTMTVVGQGFGPLTVGALSDLFSVAHPDESLRYAFIAVLVPVLTATAGVLFAAGRSMPEDARAVGVSDGVGSLGS